MRPTTPPVPRALAVVATLLTLSLLPTTVAAQELDEVQAERADIEAELEAAQLRLEETETEVVTRQQELEALTERREELEEQLVRTRDALAVRARSAFKRGSDLGTLEALLSGSGPQSALDRASSLDALARRDTASIESAESLTQQLTQAAVLEQQALADVTALEAELETVAAELATDLDRIKALEADVVARDARKKQISRGVQDGTYACMMGEPYSYIDSWGYPRPNGRTHKGTDVMAPFGTEVYAFTDGYVSRMKSGGIGGIVLYLQGDDGVRYYYAHLQGYAAETQVGRRVEAGELIAYNGASGNARGGAPHVHFEVQPGGGAPVNPYPWLTPVCPR